jgi:hypothetical protein
MQKRFVIALAALFAGAAAAQGARDPNDPQVKVPPAEYRSVFEEYRPFADQEVGDWRKANEEVGAAGGHAGLAKQGQKPAAQPVPKSKEGHGGHK